MNGRCVLAVDTSTTRASLAVVKDGRVVFEEVFVSKRSHNSQLFAPLAAALDAAGDDLDLVVVGLGPGSYTGVRIAIAAGHGVALSRGVPLVGWSSLAAADGVEEMDYRVIGDARRGRLFVAEVKAGKLEGAPEIVSREEGLKRVADGGGPPWMSFDDKGPLAEEDWVRWVRPSAAGLARRVEDLPDAEVERMAAEVMEPLYLEGAFITTAKKRGK